METIKILTVDDDSSILDGYETILPFIIENKVEITKAINGQDALRKLEESNKFDLIITDINMPLIDGIKFVEMVKNKEKYNKHKKSIIIMSTAFNDKATIAKAINAGADGYITKPFDIADLQKVLQTYSAIIGLNLSKTEMK